MGSKSKSKSSSSQSTVVQTTNIGLENIDTQGGAVLASSLSVNGSGNVLNVSDYGAVQEGIAVARDTAQEALDVTLEAIKYGHQAGTQAQAASLEAMATVAGMARDQDNVTTETLIKWGTGAAALVAAAYFFGRK